MKRFIPLLISIAVCLSFFSCNFNSAKTASVSVVIPGAARSALPEGADKLVYYFMLTNDQEELISQKTGTPGQAVIFEELEPGNYIMTVAAAPADNPTEFVYGGTSDPFTLAAGEEKSIQIKMGKIIGEDLDEPEENSGENSESGSGTGDGETSGTGTTGGDSKKESDDGITVEAVINPTDGGIVYVVNYDGTYCSADINLESINEELQASGNSYESGDSVLFCLKFTPTKNITDFNYEGVITAEGDPCGTTGWNTVLGNFNANEQVEISLPLNMISLEYPSYEIGTLRLYFKDSSFFQETLNNVELSVKLYKKNSENNTTTCILRKGVYESQYRYEALLSLTANTAIASGSQCKINMQGKASNDATVNLAIINGSADVNYYRDITSNNTSGTQAKIDFKKDEPVLEAVQFTLNTGDSNNDAIKTGNDSNGNPYKYQLQLISPCNNTSYTDVLIIYNFPTELSITQ